MKKYTPLIIGAITGLVMAGYSFWAFSQKNYSDAGIYFMYAVYVAGIATTLFLFSRSASYNGKFGSIFGEGFKCFIIVTLVMVLYYFIIGNLHPELADEYATAYKNILVKEGNKTPVEIEDIYQRTKKGYLTGVIYTTVFTTMISGAFFTALGAGLLLMRRK